MNQKNFFVISSYLLVSIIFANCKKESEDTFCSEKRTNTGVLNSDSAIVIYYQKYSRYGLKFKRYINGNIDTQVIGLLCDLPESFKSIGTSVIVTGNLQNFNSSENYSPQMAGDSLFFLEITNLKKQ